MKHIMNQTLHSQYNEGDNEGAKAWDHIQVWVSKLKYRSYSGGRDTARNTWLIIRNTTTVC